MSSRKSALLLGALLLVSSPRAHAGSLYDDLGQKPGIDRLVAQTIKVWSADPRVASIFEETNLVRLSRLLSAQICVVSGGDCVYTGRSMAESHKGLHLATAQFNAVAEDVQSAMEQLGYAYSVQNRLLAVLAPMKRDVVTR